PARRQTSPGHSTMKVLVRPSNGYAWTWNRPCWFSRKTNVNAGKTRSVPNHAYFVVCTSSERPNASSLSRRTVLFTPSAPTTRSYPPTPARAGISVSNRRSTSSDAHRRWRMPSSCTRAIAENACPRERRVSPRYRTSMASHVAKVSVISSNVVRSASRSAPSVSSENTTPQPKVAPGGLRSSTVTWWSGFAFLRSRARYRPAGPPPIVRTRTSGKHLGEAIDLLDARHRGQEDQVVASRLLVPADELAERPGGGEIARRDPVGERPRERIIVAQVRGSSLGRGVASNGEVALAPELGTTGALEVCPGGERLRHRRGESARRPPAVHVPVAVPRHPRERLTARAAHEERRPAGANG